MCIRDRCSASSSSATSASALLRARLRPAIPIEMSARPMPAARLRRIAALGTTAHAAWQAGHHRRRLRRHSWRVGAVFEQRGARPHGLAVAVAKRREVVRRVRFADAAAALVGTSVAGGSIHENVLTALAEAASAACDPIDDKRGTIAYRRQVAGVLAKRAATIAVERAQNGV